jgi:RimJ/RimL family protein N-acetyltransferase/aryl carrier-like protein
MTLTTRTPEPARSVPGRRETLRRELAELVEVDPAELSDHVRFADDLGLDSLAMMRVLVWLEGRGVVADDRSRPARVADVLALAEAATRPGLSVTVVGGPPGALPGVTDLPAPRPPAPDPLAPGLTGHGIRLDPVVPDDTRFLYSLAAAPETGFRWRYRGVPPSLDRFATGMWDQIVVQYVARRVDDNQPVGHLIAYGADPTTRFVHAGAVFVPSCTGSGLAARTVGMFVRYLFHTLPLVKVYLEVPGFNWPQISSGEGTLFRVEGVLRDHLFYAGRTWHQYLCAIYRDSGADG